MLKKVALIFAGIFIVALGVFVNLSMKQSRDEFSPDFSLPDQNRQQISLTQLNGKVVLINFWATWCTPCREELPHFERLYQQYQSEDFEILAINVGDDKNKIDAFLSNIDISFPVLLDSDAQVSRLYEVNAMPTTIIIDKLGRQRMLHLGYRSGDEEKYYALITTLLKD